MPRPEVCVGTVIIDDEKEYHAWLEQQKTFAELSSGKAVVKATYQSGGK